MSPRPFGTLPTGETIACHTLMAGDAVVEILELGGIVRTLRVPDRAGRSDDVVLGFDRLEDYLDANSYFGAIVERIAGRVKGGQLMVGGQSFALPCNDGPNHLHGGRRGLDRRRWSATPIATKDGSAALRLNYHSPDGEEGYPGSVDITVIYRLTPDHCLIVESLASADRPTPLCLAHHSYYNLAGEGTGDISGHKAAIFARDYEPPADTRLTHSGRRSLVDGLPVDLRAPRRLAHVLPSLFQNHGDFYWLRNLGATLPDKPTLAARFTEPTSGRLLEVFTDDWCLQFYSGAHFNGSLVGKSGRPYRRHAGFCVECQGHPDAADRPEWGEILVRPGQLQRRTTIYRFSTT